MSKALKLGIPVVRVPSLMASVMFAAPTKTTNKLMRAKDIHLRNDFSPSFTRLVTNKLYTQ